MKANRIFGCRTLLRFMSEHNEHSPITSAEDLQLSFEMSGDLQVLLGNFRSFSFPMPTFETGGNAKSPVAIQTVQLIVPGFMAMMIGASHGYDAELKVMLQWRLTRNPASKAWLIDHVEILDIKE